MSNGDILAHYGIKGMKWGIRRTEAQLARARGSSLSATKKASSKSSSKPKTKSISEMSDEELRARVNRIRLENDYKSLTPKQVSKGKKFVDDFITKPLAEASKNVIRDLMEQELRKALKVQKRKKK